MRRLAFVVTLICLFGEQLAHGQRDRIKIEWPSAEFRTFQAFVDAVPNGALIEIRPGDYPMGPVFVRGKTLEFAGAGSGRKAGKPVTRLLGPAPRPIVDEEGNLLQPADSVTGLFNLIAANVVIRDLVMEGSDAAVVTRNDEDGNSGPTLIQDVVIHGAGRGINALGSGDLMIMDTVIQHPLWHGISVSPQDAAILHVQDTVILTPFCAGAFFTNTSGVFTNVTISGASCGGIVGIQGKGALILDSHLLKNGLAGILLFETPGAFIGDNLIEETFAGSINHPALKICVANPDCGGDGIELLASGHITSIDLRGNTIRNSHRGSLAVWGSTVALEDNTMTCSAFDIDVEAFQGVNSSLDDLGGNKCGCGGPLGECLAVSSSLAPPPFIQP